MGAFAGALQSLGGTASNIAGGKMTLDEWRNQNAMNQLNLAVSKMRMQQLQDEMRRAGVPQFVGEGPNGEMIQRDPNTGQLSLTSVAGASAAKAPRIAFHYTDNDGNEIAVFEDGSQKTLSKAATKPTAGESFTQSGQYVTADGKKGFGYRSPKGGGIVDAATGQPVNAVSFVPASEQPTTTPEISFQTVEGPGGENQLEAITGTKTAGKTGGGSITINKPIPIGPKALPAGTAEKLNSMVASITPTLDALKRMRGSIDILKNPMTAARIKLATSLAADSLASRSLTLTPQEEQFATDYRTTAEGINAVRQALQATGFRGSEAWGTMLQQRGTILGNPDISKGILDNSIAILQGQVDQANKMLGGGALDKKGALTREEASEYLRRAGGDKEKARQLARADGRTF